MRDDVAYRSGVRIMGMNWPAVSVFTEPSPLVVDGDQSTCHVEVERNLVTHSRES